MIPDRREKTPGCLLNEQRAIGLATAEGLANTACHVILYALHPRFWS